MKRIPVYCAALAVLIVGIYSPIPIIQALLVGTGTVAITFLFWGDLTRYVVTAGGRDGKEKD